MEPQELWNSLTQEGMGRNLAMAALVLLAAIAAYFLARFFCRKTLHVLAARTKTRLDDVVLRHGVLGRAALLVPAVVVYYGSELFPTLAPGAQRILHIYILAVLALTLSRLLSAFLEFYETLPVAGHRPMKGYVQLAKIFMYVVSVLVAVSLILDISPWGLLSGVGAMTAVVLLIFRDTILSVLAGMQITGYQLLRRGDWIEMPAFGADGDVVDIALHTVKVQNFDKTVVAIPTHKFLDHSFKNWRGMREAGGRRIKRSVLIDQASIRLLDKALYERLKKIRLIRDYLAQKEEELLKHNRQYIGAGEESLVNGRHLTNIGTFRAYVFAYLKNHPQIRQDLTLMVRQLDPKAESGLPLEVYAFTTVTAWAEYEAVQADIFDHLLAVLPEFGLGVYQRHAHPDTRTSPEETAV